MTLTWKIGSAIFFADSIFPVDSKQKKAYYNGVSGNSRHSHLAMK